MQYRNYSFVITVTVFRLNRKFLAKEVHFCLFSLNCLYLDFPGFHPSPYIDQAQ